MFSTSIVKQEFWFAKGQGRNIHAQPKLMDGICKEFSDRVSSNVEQQPSRDKDSQEHNETSFRIIQVSSAMFTACWQNIAIDVLL